MQIVTSQWMGALKRQCQGPGEQARVGPAVLSYLCEKWPVLEMICGKAFILSSFFKIINDGTCLSEAFFLYRQAQRSKPMIPPKTSPVLV